MTQEAKLEALMQKAIDGGLKSIPYNGDKIYIYDAKAIVDDIFDGHDQPDLFTVIFSKDFARALFGEELLQTNIDANYRGGETFDLFGCKAELDGDSGASLVLKMPAYHARLLEAVISDNPMDYMYKVVFPE